MAMPQRPFDVEDFFLNGERRLPCVILADRSGSMDGPKLDALNQGLQVYAEAISADQLALKRVETALVSFGPVQVERDFATLDKLTMPHLDCGGVTPMGEAVNKALDLLEARQQQYKANGIGSYNSWLWLITDGLPTDEWTAAAARLRSLDAQKKVMAFTIGVDDADTECLKAFSTKPPLMLKETRFVELFEFISKLMTQVSNSRPGDRIPIPNQNVENFAEVCA